MPNRTMLPQDSQAFEIIKSLRQTRTQKGLPSTLLGELAGVSSALINRYEKYPERGVTVVSYNRLAKALDWPSFPQSEQQTPPSAPLPAITEQLTIPMPQDKERKLSEETCRKFLTFIDDLGREICKARNTQQELLNEFLGWIMTD